MQWQFEADSAASGEEILKFTATLTPGWHLYSQFMEEGGPMPTRFTFEQNKDFVLIGRTEEIGKPVTFQDSIFGIAITWYSGKIFFLQKIRSTQPIMTVRGTVEYMACDDYICIPAKRDFSINLKQTE